MNKRERGSTLVFTINDMFDRAGLLKAISDLEFEKSNLEKSLKACK